MAPRYIGWPQNFVSTSLCIRMCFTHSVSFGGSMGGTIFVRWIWIVPGEAGIDVDAFRDAVEIAGLGSPNAGLRLRPWGA